MDPINIGLILQLNKPALRNYINSLNWSSVLNFKKMINKYIYNITENPKKFHPKALDKIVGLMRFFDSFIIEKYALDNESINEIDIDIDINTKDINKLKKYLKSVIHLIHLKEFFSPDANISKESIIEKSNNEITELKDLKNDIEEKIVELQQKLNMIKSRRRGGRSKSKKLNKSKKLKKSKKLRKSKKYRN